MHYFKQSVNIPSTVLTLQYIEKIVPKILFPLKHIVTYSLSELTKSQSIVTIFLNSLRFEYKLHLKNV